jgi:hypothetical protein
VNRADFEAAKAAEPTHPYTPYDDNKLYVKWQQEAKMAAMARRLRRKGKKPNEKGTRL